MFRNLLSFLPCSVVLIFFACATKNSEPIKTDVEMRQVLVESTPGCKYDSMQCAHYEVSYPVFVGLDTAVQTSILLKLTKALNGEVEEKVISIEAAGNEFVTEFNEFKAETPDNFGRWYRSVGVEVMIFNDSLLSLQISDETYSGGAHGSYATTFLNLNPSSGDTLSLSDFLKPGYEQSLTKIGEQIFRETRELADTASLEFNGFEFGDNQFGLNSNYGFRKEGIVFFYNSYEVAPYAMGPTEVVIPYERIRDWMKSRGSNVNQ
ncbi:DUF3298 and DUF4163 domain-containing protein [soil metagenome]